MYSGEPSRKLSTTIFPDPVSYEEGYALQKELHSQVAAGRLNDQLLLLEHLPVYTLGKRAEESDFLLGREALTRAGADIVEIDRGGQITYHGPGQIVLYVISNLGDRARSIRRFVDQLEQVVMDYLEQEFDIHSGRNPRHPGVWVGDAKIAAVGISIHEKTSMHGFALNLRPDLSAFAKIIPCGIRDKEVCSVKSLLRSRVRPTANSRDDISLQDFSGEDTSQENISQVDIHQEMRKVAEHFRRIYGYSEMEISSRRI